jgi:hypothetical protein
MVLSCCKVGVKRVAMSIAEQMDFRRKTATGAA